MITLLASVMMKMIACFGVDISGPAAADQISGQIAEPQSQRPNGGRREVGAVSARDV